jgi:hypothetical protein
MTRMGHWWRAYDECVDDPKLGKLGDRLHRAWFNLCCVASSNDGVLPPIADAAFKLRVTDEKAAELIAALVSAELFDRRPDGKLEPHNWEGRQFKSDVSTPRVKRFRERQRNGEAGEGGAVSATPPDSETDSDAEQKKDTRASGARYSAEFEERFWQPYPRTPNMSKLEAWRAWDKSPDDHAAIVAAVPRYAAWLRSKPDHPVVHACRFITQRRFDGFGSPEAPARPAGTFYAKPESPELAAWDRWSRRTRGKPMLRDRGGGWWVDAQWPPGDPRSVTPRNTAADQLAARAVERPAAAKTGGEDEDCTQTPRAAADA